MFFKRPRILFTLFSVSFRIQRKSWSNLSRCSRSRDMLGRHRRHSVAGSEDDGWSSCSSLIFLRGGCADCSALPLEPFLWLKHVWIWISSPKFSCSISSKCICMIHFSNERIRLYFRNSSVKAKIGNYFQQNHNFQKAFSYLETFSMIVSAEVLKTIDKLFSDNYFKLTKKIRAFFQSEFTSNKVISQKCWQHSEQLKVHLFGIFRPAFS